MVQSKGLSSAEYITDDSAKNLANQFRPPRMERRKTPEISPVMDSQEPFLLTRHTGRGSWPAIRAKALQP